MTYLVKSLIVTAIKRDRSRMLAQISYTSIQATALFLQGMAPWWYLLSNTKRKVRFTRRLYSSSESEEIKNNVYENAK
jgi:hypothetical protein